MGLRKAKYLKYQPVPFVSDKATLLFLLLLTSPIGAKLKENNLLLLNQIISLNLLL